MAYATGSSCIALRAVRLGPGFLVPGSNRCRLADLSLPSTRAGSSQDSILAPAPPWGLISHATLVSAGELLDDAKLAVRESIFRRASWKGGEQESERSSPLIFARPVARSH